MPKKPLTTERPMQGQENLWYQYYDTEIIPATPTTIQVLTFFKNVGSKNRWQTNVDQNSTLAYGYRFKVQQITLKFICASQLLADLLKFKNNQPFLSIEVQNKTKVELPADVIPGGADLINGGSTTLVNNGFASAKNVYSLRIPFMIYEGESFVGRINFLASSLTAVSEAISVRLGLIGTLTRPQK